MTISTYQREFTFNWNNTRLTVQVGSNVPSSNPPRPNTFDNLLRHHVVDDVNDYSVLHPEFDQDIEVTCDAGDTYRPLVTPSQRTFPVMLLAYMGKFYILPTNAYREPVSRLPQVPEDTVRQFIDFGALIRHVPYIYVPPFDVTRPIAAEVATPYVAPARTPTRMMVRPIRRPTWHNNFFVVYK